MHPMMILYYVPVIFLMLIAVFTLGSPGINFKSKNVNIEFSDGLDLLMCAIVPILNAFIVLAIMVWFVETVIEYFTKD